MPLYQRDGLCHNWRMYSQAEHIEGNVRLNAMELQRVHRVVDELVSAPLPATVMNRLMAKAFSPYAEPFERYAGIALKDSGAGELIQELAGRPLRLSPPGDGHLAQLSCPSSSDGRIVELTENVEGTLNRLCSIADALEDSADLGDPCKPLGITVSGLGGAFKPDRPVFRSAHVRLPRIEPTETPNQEYFNEVDWRALDHVAVIARSVFQSSLLPNMHQAFMGAYAPTGSDWDVRARLALLLGKLELPLRCTWSFDCDIPERTAAIRFSAPSAGAFPRQGVVDGDMLRNVDDRLDDARLVYTLRLCCLMAAVCFGAGRSIETAHIEARTRDESLVTCAFNRHGFVHDTLVSIAEGRLCSPELRFDPEGAAQAAAPRYIELGAPTPSRAFEPATRIDPHLDTRPLSADLEGFFHARRICDIDTRHYFGGNEHVIKEARLDSDESVLAAIASLEDAVVTLEARTVPPDDDANARPLYCSNPLSRAMVSLLDDELSVSLQAEAFLHGASEPSDAGYANTAKRLPHYFRAPHALFQAHVGLSDLYGRLGDHRGAQREADRALALAPTTAQAYYRKADDLAQQERFAEAANTLVAGLRCAVHERDCALLYYHLGLVLWKLGRHRDAAAVHVYTMSLSGEYAEKSAAVVRSLRKRKGSPVITHASPLAASREMSKAHIPIAPSDMARTLVVHAAIGLSCADAPEAAAPYAAAIAGYFRNDPVVCAAADSLINGLR